MSREVGEPPKPAPRPAAGDTTGGLESSDRPAVWADAIPSRLGDYEIEGEIGRGGMGLVYLGRDTKLGRTVAIKALPDVLALDPNRRVRFQREAKLLAMVGHANIAAIYHIVEVEDRSYLVLEYVPGETLADRLANGPLALADALRISRQVAVAIEAAHARGVIHRDLKPANVRVTPEGIVKVLDFGLAKTLNESDPVSEPSDRDVAIKQGDAPGVTRAGAVLGTVAYMSPEQLLGQAVDQRIDVWAFGCVLFECLTGSNPWHGDANDDRLEVIRTSGPDWSELPVDTPKRLRILLERCLEKERPRRLQRMSEVVAELAAVLDELAGGSARVGGPATATDNLPGQLTGFLGRETELSELDELIEKNQIVTLTGPGGTGKTRLAIELAQAIRDRFRDGAWLIDLAAIHDPSQLWQTVAATLGIKEQSDRLLAATLAEGLAAQQMLLILDNCEHMIPASASLVAALLETCPDVRILATSQAPLTVASERLYNVMPLRAPAAGGHESVEELGRLESVQLFVNRGRAVVPSFRLDEVNAPWVAQICRRLDGLPLAIELAAARLRALSAKQITERLDDRFRLLRSTDRSTPARHKTLRALLEWSHESLEEEERALLRRLSVFAGSFAVEAAESICSWPPVAEEEVLDLLTGLLDRSLVVVEKRGAVVRYRLLETVRAYGRERLVEAGDETVANQRHLDHYLGLSLQAESALRGPGQVLWVERAEEELDNFSRALRTDTGQSDDVAKRVRMAVALRLFWAYRGHIREGREILMTLLDTKEVGNRGAIRVQALNAAGWCSRRMGDLEPALRLQQEALSIARDLDSDEMVLRCLGELSATLTVKGDHAAARGAVDERMVLCGRLDDRVGMAEALTDEFSLLLQASDHPAARAAVEKSLEIFRSVGDKGRTAESLSNLAVLEVRTGRARQARAHLEESLEFRKELGDRRGMAVVWINLAMVDAQTGELPRAAERLRRGKQLSEELDDKVAVATALNNLAWLALQQEHYAETRACLVDGLRLARRIPHRVLVLNLLENTARLELAVGHFALAARITGAVEAARSAHATNREVSDDEDQLKAVTAMKERLGDEAYESELTAGRGMSLEEVIDLALTEPVDDEASTD